MMISVRALSTSLIGLNLMLATQAPAEAPRLKKTDVVTASKLLDEIKDELLSIGEYDISQQAGDAQHCAVHIRAKPSDVKVTLKTVDNTTIDGSIGGTIYILTITATGSHSNIKTGSVANKFSMDATKLGTRKALMSVSASDPQLSASANALRRLVEDQLRTILDSDHSLPCVRKPSSLVFDNAVEVDNKAGGSLKIAWLATISIGPTKSRNAIQDVEITYSLKTSDEYVAHLPNGIPALNQ